MAFCHKCGYKLDPDDKFCFECGTPVRKTKSPREFSPTESFTDGKPKIENKDEQNVVPSIQQEIIAPPVAAIDNSVVEDVVESDIPEKQTKINRTPLIITIVLIGIFLHICLIIGVGMSSVKREVADTDATVNSALERDAGGNNWFWKPSPTPSPTPTPKPVIKVSSKSSRLSDTTKWGTWELKYPQVSISGKNTDSLNSKIESDFKKYDYNWKDDNSKPYNSSFTYFIDDDVISILVEIKHDSKYFKYLNYVVYNVSIETGNLMSDSDVVKKSGLNDKDFLFLVKKTYNQFEAGISWVNQPIKDRCKKANLERISYQYVKPYFSLRGDLCFVGYVDHAGKLKKGNLCFNASLCSCITEIEY